MKIYNYHPDTLELVGESVADNDPLDAANFLIPAHATETKPPKEKAGFTRHFDGGAWVYREIPQPVPEPEPAPLTYAQLRAQEYPPMTDYLDGIVKNDQAQINKYIADCLAVKAKYPKPVTVG